LQWLHNHHHPSTACYQHLTTNTASPILGSFDFPWPKDTPYFLSHRDVQAYLQNYATHFGLDPWIHLSTRLDNVAKKEDGKWHLTLTAAIQKDDDAMSIKTYDETFDAVVIATGQFQDPTLPPLHGLVEYNAHFPGRITHSKQFRRNEDFKDKVTPPPDEGGYYVN
jgi:cation diffusion facilitator CzcD-associated flavoprotein CzcO